MTDDQGEVGGEGEERKRKKNKQNTHAMGVRRREKEPRIYIILLQGSLCDVKGGILEFLVHRR